jgi:hypothetical protein
MSEKVKIYSPWVMKTNRKTILMFEKLIEDKDEIENHKRICEE